MLPFASIATIVCLLPSLQLPSLRIPQEAADQTFALEAGEYRVTELVERSGTFLGRNYLMRTDSTACQPDSQMVKITKRLELDRKGCEEVISQLLFYQDWIMTPLDAARGIYEWVHVTGSRFHQIKQRSFYKSPDEVLARPNLYVYVTTTVAVKHVNSQRITANLRSWWNDPRGLQQILPMDGDRAGTIFIAGMAHQVAQMLLAIRETDKEGADLSAQRRSVLQDMQKQIADLRRQVQKLSGK